MASSFGAESTTDDVLAGVDLSRQARPDHRRVRGTRPGTARALVAHGAKWSVAARDLDKANAARPTRSRAGGGERRRRSILVELDLASLASVRRCADGVARRRQAVRRRHRQRRRHGLPATARLPTASRPVRHQPSGPLRVRQPASAAAGAGPAPHREPVLGGAPVRDVDLDDPNFERTPYHPFVGVRSLEDRQHPVRGRARPPAARGIRAAAVHPGGIQTELGRHMTPEPIAHSMRRPRGGRRSSGRRSRQGAATQRLGRRGRRADEVGGRYCEDCHVAELTKDPTVRHGVRPNTPSIQRTPMRCGRRASNGRPAVRVCVTAEFRLPGFEAVEHRRVIGQDGFGCWNIAVVVGVRDFRNIAVVVGVRATGFGGQDTQKRHPCRSPSASMPRTVLPTEPRGPYTPDHQRGRTSHRTEHQRPEQDHRPTPTTPFSRTDRWTTGVSTEHVSRPIAGGSSERVAAPRCVTFQHRCLVCRTVRGMDAEGELHGCTCRVSCKPDIGAETPAQR